MTVTPIININYPNYRDIYYRLTVYIITALLTGIIDLRPFITTSLTCKDRITLL